MKEKQRLDIALTILDPELTREKARSLIMDGKVFVDHEKALKPGQPVGEQNKIEIRGEKLKYVSRGGLKLEKAIDEFGINLENKICADVGASTGGFTDCMLQNGACKVYSVDVGYGQLAWKLRNDNRVINLERTNIRFITKDQIPDPLDFISIDVSFISLKLVLPAVKDLLRHDGVIVALVKPQFEAGKDLVGKKGVVRSSETHQKVLETVFHYCIDADLNVTDLSFSPVKGPEGNIEFLIKIEKSNDSATIEIQNIERIVLQSHHDLDGDAV